MPTQLSPFWPHFLTTLAQRPYVFAFLICFLIFATLQLGWRRMLIFLGLGWTLAFLSEVSSIRNGFPYGDYQYVYENLKGELLLWGVPLWDSLSYTFLAYASYGTAILLFPPSCRSSWRVLLLSVLLMTGIDGVIDPLTALGDRWFLGKIYYYPQGGIYFGVPLTNFAGWALVAFGIIGIFQRLELFLSKVSDPHPNVWQGFRAYLGFLLYSGVFLFNWIITLYLKEFILALCDFILFGILLVALFYPSTRKGKESVEVLRRNN